MLRTTKEDYNDTFDYIKKRIGHPYNENEVYNPWIKKMANQYIDYVNNNCEESFSPVGMQVYFDYHFDVSLIMLFQIERYNELNRRYMQRLPGKIEHTKDRIREWNNILDDINKRHSDPYASDYEKVKSKTDRDEAIKKLDFFRDTCILYMEDYLRDKE